MCGFCGCGQSEHVHQTGHTHEHEHGHSHTHHHTHPGETLTLALEEDLLAHNRALAAQNRAWLDGRQVRAFNLISSPGAGKTSLLEATLARLKGQTGQAARPLLVVEGDPQTERDAQRMRAAGAKAVQVTTGQVCHLDAHMAAHALEELNPPQGALVAIENVGNLICPALFDLGEHGRVVLVSVTEGEDKPLKYPQVFQEARLVVITKTDLLPHLDYRLEDCLANLAHVCPQAAVLQLSAKTGQGMEGWMDWLAAL